jgi:hypothetical protein
VVDSYLESWLPSSLVDGLRTLLVAPTPELRLTFNQVSIPEAHQATQMT